MKIKIIRYPHSVGVVGHNLRHLARRLLRRRATSLGWAAVIMFKAIIFCALYNRSDGQVKQPIAIGKSRCLKDKYL